MKQVTGAESHLLIRLVRSLSVPWSLMCLESTWPNKEGVFLLNSGFHLNRTSSESLSTFQHRCKSSPLHCVAFSIKPCPENDQERVQVFVDAARTGTFKSVFCTQHPATHFEQVGLFAVLVALVSMKDEHAEKIVAFMKPGVDLLTAFLPAFFIPALIVSPLSLSSMSGCLF